MSSQEIKLVLNYTDEGSGKISVEYIQIFIEKPATTLKCTALIVHTVHVVLLNNWKTFQSGLIEIDRTVLGFLQVAEKEEWRNWFDGISGIVAC